MPVYGHVAYGIYSFFILKRCILSLLFRLTLTFWTPAIFLLQWPPSPGAGIAGICQCTRLCLSFNNEYFLTLVSTEFSLRSFYQCLHWHYFLPLQHSMDELYRITLQESFGGCHLLAIVLGVRMKDSKYDVVHICKEFKRWTHSEGELLCKRPSALGLDKIHSPKMLYLCSNLAFKDECTNLPE